MKVKLYHKFVKYALNHAYERKFMRSWVFGGKMHMNELVIHPLKENGGVLVEDEHILKFVQPHNFLSTAWHDLRICDRFREKYRRHSRKYWTEEAQMLRAIKGEDED